MPPRVPVEKVFKEHFLKPQLHIHYFGHGRATIHPHL